MLLPTLPKGWESWKPEALIGEGAYGAVYKASHTIGSVTDYSAVKIIRIPENDSRKAAMIRELGSVENAREYFRDMVDSCIREIDTMIGLKGITNIVSVEDSALAEDPDGFGWTIYIRMELLQSFPDYMQEHTLTEAEAVRVGIDICTALTYCEKAGIIHRDIKPSNIFRSQMGNFKLGDFGVARKTDKTDGLYSARGTYPFMAPEIFNGQSYDKRADIYSLGLVLYRLLNRNRDPFTDPDKRMIYMKDREEAMARRISGEKLPEPAEASAKAARVILKACEFKPEKRYQSASEFLQALRECLPEPERKMSGKKRLIIAAAAVVAAAGIITAILTNRPGRPETQAPEPVPATEIPAPEPAAEPTPHITAEPTDEPTLVPTAEPTAELTPEPAAEPAALLPLTVVELSGDEVKPFLMDRMPKVSVNRNAIADILLEQGCAFTEEEQDYLRENLKNQFSLEGNENPESGGRLTEGGRVTVVYSPDETFLALLRGKGYEIRFEPRVYTAVKDDGGTVRLVPQADEK